jgi:Zn-dependent protease with chaperone function
LTQEQRSWPFKTSSVAGTFYDGETGQGRQVQVRIADGLVHFDGPDVSTAFPLASVRLEARLGDLPRRIDLPNGASCIVPAEFELPVTADAPATMERWVNEAETRWAPALAAAAVLVAILWAGIVWGVPAAANVVARRMSPAIEREMGEQALRTLEAAVLERSKLTAARQQALSARFDTLVRFVPAGTLPQLRFHASPTVGPNAFALPGGTVVLLDELVAEARHDDEIAAVLAHEIGHLVERHSIRQVLQTSVAGVLVAVVVGDVLSLSSYAAALPAVLLNARYSRAFEREADRFGFALLDQAGIDRTHFVRFLTRLEQKHGGAGMGWLSSHPGAEERGRAAGR